MCNSCLNPKQRCFPSEGCGIVSTRTLPGGTTSHSKSNVWPEVPLLYCESELQTNMCTRLWVQIFSNDSFLLCLVPRFEITPSFWHSPVSTRSRCHFPFSYTEHGALCSPHFMSERSSYQTTPRTEWPLGSLCEPCMVMKIRAEVHALEQVPLERKSAVVLQWTPSSST